MDWKFIFFSFNGRLRRKHYWLAALIQLAIMLAVLTVADLVRILFRHDLASTLVVAVFELAWLVFVLWAGLAVAVKRCHDRDQSGWWFFLILIPLLGGLWNLINLGILDGTPGPNRFGPSPKFDGNQAEVFA
jgi:uncharacterized membrane protein YhaH (DUF805 family)